MTNRLDALRLRLWDGWRSLPRSVRSFVVDAAEGSVAAVLLLNLAIPHSLSEASATALVVGAALVSPIVAAARRTLLPALLRWWVSVRESAG